MIDGNRPSSEKILVIDDEIELINIIQEYFSQAGFRVYTATDGGEGLQVFFNHRPNMIILDIMMPGMSGIEVCQRIRELSDVPIIMLTALSKNEQIIQALECGADEYVTKPFDLAVLLARTRAVLRRSYELISTEDSISYGDDYLTVDLVKHRVTVRGQVVRVSVTEFRLLAYLIQNANQLLTFQQILAQVWGEGYEGNPEYVHTYIWQLRHKLEEDPANPTYLLTEHGLGYRFEKRKADEPLPD